MPQARRSMAGGVNRLLIELTSGADDERAAAREALVATQGGEYMQQIHARVSGLLGRRPMWQEATVGFIYPFLYDPTRRDSGLENPTFSSGVELMSGGPCFLQTQLVRWVKNDEEWVTGATLSIGAYAPGAPKKTKFDAIVHLLFVGYAAAAEEATSG